MMGEVKLGSSDNRGKARNNIYFCSENNKLKPKNG